ncbi:hypothetical protein [Streptomyces sp. XY413]|uniref:hypothetical protein n=1 Tax=Streptomyces sp. XY413 TaxID=1519479 RepID=UPI00131CBA37|nr:hypothetical protein [Streptomyces sp. XY413]
MLTALCASRTDTSTGVFGELDRAALSMSSASINTSGSTNLPATWNGTMAGTRTRG